MVQRSPDIEPNRHQEVALAVMTERESGSLLLAHWFPVLWVEEDHGRGTKMQVATDANIQRNF